MPTFLSSEQIRTLIGKVGQHFQLTSGNTSDYSIELDPRKEKPFGITFYTYFAEELERLKPMINDELLTLNEDRTIVVTPRGKLLIRNICMQFDHYLNQPMPTEKQEAIPRYSKVI